MVHGIGDFLPAGFDFMVPARKGTRLAGVRLRIRRLAREDVIPVGGLPALTVERALADLVEIGTDLSLVAGAARDAARAASSWRRIAWPLISARSRPGARATAGHWPVTCSSWRACSRRDGAMAERDGASREGYGDWRSLELAIKEAAKAAGQARPGRASAGRSGRPASTGSCPVSSPRASGPSGCSTAG